MEELMIKTYIDEIEGLLKSFERENLWSYKMKAFHPRTEEVSFKEWLIAYKDKVHKPPTTQIEYEVVSAMEYIVHVFITGLKKKGLESLRKSIELNKRLIVDRQRLFKDIGLKDKQLKLREDEKDMWMRECSRIVREASEGRSVKMPEEPKVKESLPKPVEKVEEKPEKSDL